MRCSATFFQEMISGVFEKWGLRAVMCKFSQTPVVRFVACVVIPRHNGDMPKNRENEAQQTHNSAGEGWTYLTELAAVHSKALGEGRAIPDVRVQERMAGATVVRISFRDGDVMADHHAPAPILVLGQSGRVAFRVAGEELVVEPGTSIHVDAGVHHELEATGGGDAVVTLVLLA